LIIYLQVSIQGLGYTIYSTW